MLQPVTSMCRKSQPIIHDTVFLYSWEVQQGESTHALLASARILIEKHAHTEASVSPHTTHMEFQEYVKARPRPHKHSSATYCRCLVTHCHAKTYTKTYCLDCCMLACRDVPELTTSLLEVVDNWLAKPLRWQTIQESHFAAMPLLQQPVR